MRRFARLRVVAPLLGAAALLVVLVFSAPVSDLPLPTGDRPAAPALDPATLHGPEAAGWSPGDLPVDDRVVVVRGSGWGHSVGMSQYGAQAKARAGHTYRQILGHYYPGTQVERHSLAGETIRVGLFRNVNVADPDRLRIATAGRGNTPPTRPVEVRLGGETVRVPRGGVWELRITDDGGLALVDSDGAVRAEGASPATVAYSFLDGEPTLLRLPQLTRPGASLSGLYQWGYVQARVEDGEMQPTLVIPLEAYLRGLAEMPSSWEPEALRAQAITGRTYAVRKMMEGLKRDCLCHLGTTPHDQAYAAWEKERGAQGDRWVTAVRATEGEVVTYDGELAWTYYSSSHGGRTEAAPDSWAYGPEQDQPYLVSVDDPWSLDPSVNNPRASWEVEFPAAAFARAVGLAVLEQLDVVERTAGGSPAVLRVAGLDFAGNPASYDFRGWRSGIAASELKLIFRSDLPSQQLTAIELRAAGEES